MEPEQIVQTDGIDSGGAELCIQTAGEPSDPAVLLIHGASASMLWWEAELCEQLAARGRFVVRYDQRDTGRSSTYPVGAPGYGMRDLAADAVAILDALGIDRAHVVGRSMSGGVALILAVDHPERVASVTFMATTTGEPGLPDPTPEFRDATAEPAPDPADREAMVGHLVRGIVAYHGTSGLTDRDHVEQVVRADLARSRDYAATLTNHFAQRFEGPRNGSFGDISAPALIMHGELDPIFPLAHARALERAIPGARLQVLTDTGHELPVGRWPDFVEILWQHTDLAERTTPDGAR